MGLWDKQATVYTPQQAAANAGRMITRGLDPAAKSLGYQSEESRVMDVMKTVDPSNLNSVTDGFRKILEINPVAASEYRTQMMPFVTKLQEQKKIEAQRIKAEADWLSATKKENPSNAEIQKIYKNVVDEYKINFCAGGLIGDHCEVPDGYANRERYAVTDENGVTTYRLPLIAEFAAEFGSNTQRIYMMATGQQSVNAADDTTKNTSVSSSENNKGIDITKLSEMFKLTDDEVTVLGDAILEAYNKNVTIEKIQEQIDLYREKIISDKEYREKKSTVDVSPSGGFNDPSIDGMGEAYNKLGY